MTAVTTALTPATDAHLRRGLAAVCAAAGIEPQQPELLKYTINAVYRVGDCVVRLARGSLAEARAARVVRAAEEFALRNIPVVRLVAGIDQPIRTDTWVATIWIHVPTTDERPQPAQLAGPLRAIHAIDDIRVELPAWTPIMKARQRLDSVRQLPTAEANFTQAWARSRLDQHLADVLAFLQDRCDRLDEQLRSTAWHLPPGVIHGDFHTGNGLLQSDQPPALCDLDGVAIGPREWDLTPIAHGAERFGRRRGDYHAFAAAYGFDVAGWSGWPVLRDVRELQLVTSVLDNIAGRPDVAEQLALRLNSILTGDRTTVWTRYR
jgi:aminoglycoside phosphotransferase (APT) family kinase protein